MFEKRLKELSKKIGEKQIRKFYILTHEKHFREIYFQNNKKAINFLKEHLSEFINFDFIDFDDEGCPGKEMQLFFSLIKNKKEHFILCLTDGMGLNLKSRGKVNLFDKYLVGNDETVKASEINYRDFDQYVQNLIDKLCKTNGFKNNVINWYRGAEGNVIYSCYEITQI